MPDNERRRKGSDETTTRLLDAAAEVFMEHGYDKAVVADIARRAGLTTGAVFSRWANKSEVMAAGVDHILDQILPDERIKQLGIEDLPVIEILAGWSANILAGDKTQDVMVQAFASARNNEAVHKSLRSYFDEQSRQLALIIERGRLEENTDPSYSTAAIMLMIQAVGVGIHLLLSVGRDEEHTPSEQEWDKLIRQFINSLSTS